MDIQDMYLRLIARTKITIGQRLLMTVQSIGRERLGIVGVIIRLVLGGTTAVTIVQMRKMAISWVVTYKNEDRK